MGSLGDPLRNPAQSATMRKLLRHGQHLLLHLSCSITRGRAERHPTTLSPYQFSWCLIAARGPGADDAHRRPHNCTRNFAPGLCAHFPAIAPGPNENARRPHDSAHLSNESAHPPNESTPRSNENARPPNESAPRSNENTSVSNDNTYILYI